MINPLVQLRKKSEELLKSQSSRPVSSGESARRTASMMNKPSQGQIAQPLGDSSVMVPAGGLSREELQLINTETAKAGIAKRMNAKANVGMYQKKGFTDLLPGGLDGANERIERGIATFEDMLATGHRRSRYGGFGTKTEDVRDGRTIQGPYRTAQEDSVRTRERDITQQEFVAAFNAPNLKLFSENEARRQAMLAEAGQRQHETNLSQIESDGRVAEARARSEGNIEMAKLNATGKEDKIRNDRQKALSDNIYNWEYLIANTENLDPKAKEALRTLIDKSRKELLGEPAAAPKPIDEQVAREFMRQAGNDPAKARALAKEAGYSF